MSDADVSPELTVAIGVVHYRALDDLDQLPATHYDRPQGIRQHLPFAPSSEWQTSATQQHAVVRAPDAKPPREGRVQGASRRRF